MAKESQFQVLIHPIPNNILKDAREQLKETRSAREDEERKLFAQEHNERLKQVDDETKEKIKQLAANFPQ